MCRLVIIPSPLNKDAEFIAQPVHKNYIAFHYPAPSGIIAFVGIIPFASPLSDWIAVGPVTTLNTGVSSLTISAAPQAVNQPQIQTIENHRLILTLLTG
jgi:hypothetical protein